MYYYVFFYPDALMYSFTRMRPPHQICYVFVCITMYFYVLCILLPGRAIRTRLFIYSYVFILMYSYVF